ncbi:DUF202 domain-containing protein [Streptomyces sp. WAC05374]|uniref:DUF202 domain-containing protein n=1 Tax=Streptomyces sp. WAC05374 TaxID=2487420 RepID=UPI000F87FDB6|nr:DUF202 domain-containing protein [Streptomyces sp. WAC05374]RST15451.1 DUF202 domain-containing protein [Streptomyces sp. WAC05374]TDF40639.1 DUF202 domain-containing protein [Streptomyces sp. WAC05374]TDF49452.1 DUF202 domain-containing protein [Streptomyces sp. WAC05374]TDF49855.1 DUF202 domain-containing protein [Streptomyces sp. WAC05374]
MAAGAVEGRDPGLQPERTRLAWRRTTLSATVAAVLAAKQAVHDGVTAAGLVGAGLSLLVWLAFLVVAHRRVRALSTLRPRPMAPRGAALAAACTIALAAFAVGVVV